jgi:four helix bundle protein
MQDRSVISRSELGIATAPRDAVTTYKDLDTWKQGIDLVEQCYQSTAKFPRSELYGLTNQLRRAAISIPSNVAEGHCRRTTKAYANHVSIALGSHGELETCVEIAFRLGFLVKEERERLQPAIDSVGRLLYGLHRSLERKLVPSP